MSGLLNPPEKDDLAKKLMARLDEVLKRETDMLTATVMDREAYLQSIGGRTRLVNLKKDFDKIYIRETTK